MNVNEVAPDPAGYAKHDDRDGRQRERQTRHGRLTDAHADVDAVDKDDRQVQSLIPDRDQNADDRAGFGAHPRWP